MILGSGWAGYGFARTLDPTKYERIIISPRSYFVFTPLLASTSVGTLEFRTILEPIRRLRGQVGFYQGWADDVDFDRKIVYVESNVAEEAASKTVVPPPLPGPSSTEGQEKAVAPAKETKPKGHIIQIPYDKLVIACGAYSQTFGIEGVREHAHFLRDIGDARRIRLRVLSLFEMCSYPPGSDPLSDDDKRTLLHFAIVGGGPTGIEFAAELHDLIHEDLAPIYPQLMRFVRITVYDVAPKVLPMFDQALAQYAMETFHRHGISVKTRHHLQRLRPADGPLGTRHGALKIKIKEYGDAEVGAGLVVWSTGLMANPFISKLASKEISSPSAHAAANNPFTPPPSAPNIVPPPTRHLLRDSRTGGLLTDGHLRALTAPTNPNPAIFNSPKPPSQTATALPDVFVIGDCAVLASNPALPKTAQVASQQASHLAKALNKAYDPSPLRFPDGTRENMEKMIVTGELRPFKFRNLGTLTYLGSWKAIHQSKVDALRGWLAWVLWRTAYLTKSMSLRNKILVPVYWVVSWIFGRGISRF